MRQVLILSLCSSSRHCRMTSTVTVFKISGLMGTGFTSRNGAFYNGDFYIGGSVANFRGNTFGQSTIFIT